MYIYISDIFSHCEIHITRWEIYIIQNLNMSQELNHAISFSVTRRIY